jgi:hypothetical protein
MATPHYADKKENPAPYRLLSDREKRDNKNIHRVELLPI